MPSLPLALFLGLQNMPLELGRSTFDISRRSSVSGSAFMEN